MGRSRNIKTLDSRNYWCTSTSKLFSGGQICIPKWMLDELDLKDGDILHLNVTENSEIIYKKRKIATNLKSDFRLVAICY